MNIEEEYVCMHVKETETDRKNIGRSHEYYFILVGNIKKNNSRDISKINAV